MSRLDDCKEHQNWLAKEKARLTADFDRLWNERLDGEYRGRIKPTGTSFGDLRSRCSLSVDTSQPGEVVRHTITVVVDLDDMGEVLSAEYATKDEVDALRGKQFPYTLSVKDGKIIATRVKDG